MSGGAYDYAYFDAEELQRVLKEMARDARQRDDIPDEFADEFDEMRETLDPDLLQAFEWLATGDYSARTFLENARKA